MVHQGAGPPQGRAGSHGIQLARPYLPLLPFFGYLTIFLLLPTAIVTVGAFQDVQGNATLQNITAVFEGEAFRDAFVRSIQLSAVTAVGGAILGALLSWAVAISSPDGRLRRVVLAACGVLAQFGGVMLAFAFVATFGNNGLVTNVLEDGLGLDIPRAATWIYSLNGLAVVYLIFQIPLMVIVFMPSLDGIRREWREASASLGGSGWSFWRHVGGPILAPSFLGALLLLFANAFSAYATAAALISQGSPIVPLRIRGALTGELVLDQANVGKALALGMIVVVAIVMILYTILQRRASRWVR